MQSSLARKLVGVYEAAAGLLGVAINALALPTAFARVPSRDHGELLVFMLASTIMFALLALAGFLVLRRHSLGAGLSVALQLTQVPMWSALGTSWIFTTGPYFGPMFTEAGLEPSIGLNLQWFAQVRGAAGPAWAVINLAPFVVLLLLRAARRDASPSATFPGSPAVSTPQTPPVAPPA